jgi:hypothetical protein
MGMLPEWLGKVVFYTALLLVLLLIIGAVSGKLPELLDKIVTALRFGGV